MPNDIANNMADTIHQLEKELKDLREQIQKSKAMLLDSYYTVEVMCNKISGTIGCEKCTYYNPETHDCEVRTYIARTRAFVKGGKNDA